MTDIPIDQLITDAEPQRPDHQPARLEAPRTAPARTPVPSTFRKLVLEIMLGRP